MKYLKDFNTENDYLGYRNGSDYLKPNVSLCEGNKMVYYNYPPPIVYEAVDLGLPSHTKWATMNVGASKPSDSGLYFQWGDVQGYKAEQVGKGEGKKAFIWADYNFSKYNTAGATLELADDAAHVNMGGDWHMPTPTQLKELTANTTSTWTTSDDGVNGRLFTSKKDRTKSIFIPAAGFALDGSVSNSGDYGYVWSSVLGTGDDYYGQYLYFNSSGVNLDEYYRYYGRSVRGVIG